MKFILTIISFQLATALCAQVAVEGYVYESGNRGFVTDASVIISSTSGKKIYGRTTTDKDGIYRVEIPQSGTFVIEIIRLPHFKHSEVVEIKGSSTSPTYVRHEITREPGYVFEITLAEKDPDPDAARGGIRGAMVEVYNNTEKKEVLVFKNLKDPEFSIDLLKGNHYTILVRKEGFLSKRMEAYVDVEGCILCFEGLGSVTPGVADNLAAGNMIGVLLANVEMERYFEGKVIGLNDIYYDSDRSDITAKAAIELDKVARFIKDNPDIFLELGAHTDSRGKREYNLSLSDKRAKAAVKYLVERKGISSGGISAQGYGESQLTNKCEDGVKCTAEEHAANRRTELKVLRVNDGSAALSLRQMKSEELMDEILFELEQEGQIMIPADGNLDDVVKQHGGAVGSKPKSQLPSNKYLSDDQNPNVDDVLQSFPKANQAVKDPTTNTTDVDQAGHSIDTVNGTLPPLSIGLDRYSPTYTGYKIVIHFSRFELSKDHPLFEKFKNLDIYTTADGNKLYMIESHPSRQSAEVRIQRRYKTSFPNAYVVGFEHGIITD